MNPLRNPVNHGRRLRKATNSGIPSVRFASPHVGASSHSARVIQILRFLDWISVISRKAKPLWLTPEKAKRVKMSQTETSQGNVKKLQTSGSKGSEPLPLSSQVISTAVCFRSHLQSFPSQGSVESLNILVYMSSDPDLPSPSSGAPELASAVQCAWFVGSAEAWGKLRPS